MIPRFRNKQADEVVARARLISAATTDGSSAAYWGSAFADNPHTDTQLAYAWSQGFRAARQRMDVAAQNASNFGPAQAHSSDTKGGRTIPPATEERTEKPLKRLPFDQSDY